MIAFLGKLIDFLIFIGHYHLKFVDKLLDRLIEFLVGLRWQTFKKLVEELAGNPAGCSGLPVLVAFESEEDALSLRVIGEGTNQGFGIRGVKPVL